MSSFFINIYRSDKLIYSNNVVFFRLFLHLEPLLLYYLQNELRGKWENVGWKSANTTSRGEDRRLFYRCYVTPMKTRAFERLCRSRCITRARRKIKRSIILIARASFLLLSDKRRSRPGKPFLVTGVSTCRGTSHRHRCSSCRRRKTSPCRYDLILLL